MREPWNQFGFGPADILLPQQQMDLTRWSVVACDQYTAQPEYWQRVDAFVGQAPSALRLILPEQKLEDGCTEQHIAEIIATMDAYLAQGLFRTLEDSLIYVERRLSSGAVRRGLVGCVDLKEYHFSSGRNDLIRATEHTVLERIPPRAKVRRSAALELPHVMLLLDDPDCKAIEHYTDETAEMECLYDFDLMEQGGHLTGWRLTEAQQAAFAAHLSALADPARLSQRYHTPGHDRMLFAVGDGNHSLAAAKLHYINKKGTPEAALARYALVELVNLHDASLVFEPIHRVCFGVQAEAMRDALLAYYPGAHVGAGQGQQLQMLWQGQEETFTIPDPPSGLTAATLQNFLDAYLTAVPGSQLDYIHGEEVARALAAQPGNVGFLLPAMEKDQLFATVIQDGALPRKTFSMGEAQDKRFYLEARRLK